MSLRIFLLAFVVWVTAPAGRALGNGQEPPNPTPAERFLFAHPSWLVWWVLPNLEQARAAGREPLITGVFCVFVETESGSDSVRHLPDLVRRTESLGLKFVYGVRHSHQTVAERANPLKHEWHDQAVRGLNLVRWEAFVLDCEPYNFQTSAASGTRYHGWSEAAQLAVAVSPWKKLIARELFVYPAHPTMTYPFLLMRSAAGGGIRTVALDHTTYAPQPDLTAYMYQRNRFWRTNGLLYCPGFYLWRVNDPAAMKAAAVYQRCWFFPRTADGHPDDLPHFGTAAWEPKPQ